MSPFTFRNQIVSFEELMEKLGECFPHLSEQIFEMLDFQTIMNLKKVSRSMIENAERTSYMQNKNFRIIKHFTNCSSDLMIKELVQNCGSTFLLTSVINKIFRQFPEGMKHINLDLTSARTTPLHIAAEHGSFAAYRLITENIDDKNKHALTTPSVDFSPLHLAARHGHFTVCKFILQNIEEKNPRNSRWLTPLHEAAYEGHFNVCQLIIGELEPVNQHPKTQIQEETPLHFAAKRGHMEVCAVFTDFEGLKDRNGNTPFHLAAKGGYNSVCEHMIEILHNIEPLNSIGLTPFHLAAKFGKISICKMIIKKIKSTEESNSFKQVSKHLTARSVNEEDIWEKIFKENVRAFQDTYGRTPLEYAIKNFYTKVEQELEDKVKKEKRNRKKPSLI